MLPTMSRITVSPMMVILFYYNLCFNQSIPNSQGCYANAFSLRYTLPTFTHYRIQQQQLLQATRHYSSSSLLKSSISDSDMLDDSSLSPSSFCNFVTLQTPPVSLKYLEFSSSSSQDDNNNNDQYEPVILLHGLLGQKRNFASLGQSLSMQLNKKRRIYALDLRNHGDNHHDWRDEMSYTDMANDVLELMNELNIPKAILIGHSMGGKVAKSLALSHPSRIAGLVVLDIAPVTYTDKDVSWNAVSNIMSVLSQLDLMGSSEEEESSSKSRIMTKRDIDLRLREKVEDAALRAFILTNLEQVRNEQGSVLRWKINIRSIVNQLDKIASFDVRNTHNNDNEPSGELKYNGDTFFVNGGASKFVQGRHMPIISQFFPNYMVTTIRGAGHWVHAEAPDDTLALLKKYLDR